jgi:hypothetical protein
MANPPIRKTTARRRRLALVLPPVTLVGLTVYGWWLPLAQGRLRPAAAAQAGQRAMRPADARVGQVESLLNGVDTVLRQFRDRWAAGEPGAARAIRQLALLAFPPGSI